MELNRKQVISTLSEIMDSMPDDSCGDWRDSLAYAIDTMSKYQKIMQIIQDTSTMAGSNDYAIAFIDIKKVVEDGNDTTNTGSN